MTDERNRVTEPQLILFRIRYLVYILPSGATLSYPATQTTRDSYLARFRFFPVWTDRSDATSPLSKCWNPSARSTQYTPSRTSISCQFIMHNVPLATDCFSISLFTVIPDGVQSGLRILTRYTQRLFRPSSSRTNASFSVTTVQEQSVLV